METVEQLYPGVVRDKRQLNTNIGVRGFFRLQIEEDGEIKGDSGWHENVVVNEGFRYFLVGRLGSTTPSTWITHVNVGEGTEPGAADNSIQSECTGTSLIRHTVQGVSNGSTSLRVLATLASSNSFISTTESIRNIGLFGHSTAVSAGALFAGNTYTASVLATNQNVNITYDINFS